MGHLISDVGVEFDGEFIEFMKAYGIRQYFTASEAPRQSGLVERNGGIWKAAARKAIKDVAARGFVDMRILASVVLGKECLDQLVWILARKMGHPSRTQAALVASGREADRRTGITGIARTLT